MCSTGTTLVAPPTHGLPLSTSAGPPSTTLARCAAGTRSWRRASKVYRPRLPELGLEGAWARTAEIVMALGVPLSAFWATIGTQVLDSGRDVGKDPVDRLL